jgi:hypothetical protein
MSQMNPNPILPLYFLSIKVVNGGMKMHLITLDEHSTISITKTLNIKSIREIVSFIAFCK